MDLTGVQCTSKDIVEGALLFLAEKKQSFNVTWNINGNKKNEKIE